jgi:hypothetical protein
MAQIFLRTFETYFSTFQNCSSKYFLFPKSRHILLPICISKQTPNPKQVSLWTKILACSKFAVVRHSC